MGTDRTRWDGPAVALGLALAAGLALRAAGLGFGLPAIYNPDEVAIMNRTLSLTQSGLNPHNFLYPSLYFYALLLWEGAAFSVGWLSGAVDSVRAFERSYFLDPSYIYLAGRWLSILCGTATIWAIAALGRRLFDRQAGAAAAWIVAVAPLAVRDAHYVKHDVPVTLLIVLAHLALSKWVERPTRSRLVLAGGVAGLAVSTHYYAVFVMAPLLLMVASRSGLDDSLSARAGRVGLASLSAALAFVVTSPFLMVEPMTALRDVVANRAIVMDRATAATGMFGSLAFYAQWLARDAIGVMSVVAASVGVVVVGRTGWKPAVLTLCFPVLFLLFIANTYPASRYLNPVLPFAALLAGGAAWWLRHHGRQGVVAATILVAVAVVEGAAGSVRTDRFLRQTDTRTLALDWFERNVAPESTVLIQPYSVPLRMSRVGLVEALVANLGSADRASVRFQRQLALEPYPAPAYRTFYLGDGGLDVDKIYVSPSVFRSGQGLGPLRALSVTHIVLKRYNVEEPAIAGLAEALAREGQLVASFSPYAAHIASEARRAVPPFLHNTDARIRPELERPGPVIEIWNID